MVGIGGSIVDATCRGGCQGDRGVGHGPLGGGQSGGGASHGRVRRAQIDQPSPYGGSVLGSIWLGRPPRRVWDGAMLKRPLHDERGEGDDVAWHREKV
jgi:hypothetical protein